MEFNEFYDVLSEDYDIMTEFEKRFKREKPFFENIVSKYNIKSALDFGCGTGFHSILLKLLNVQVVGIDSSKGMVEQAKKNASKLNHNIEFLNSDLEKFNLRKQQKFDAIFCLGNTLPHFIDSDLLHKAFGSFANMLDPFGIIVLQFLNYKKILENKERIVNTKEIDNKIYIRFYDFHDQLLTFNILTLKRLESKFQHNLISTHLFPYTSDKIILIGNDFGLVVKNIYGSINLDPFDETKSENVILILSKELKLR